MELVRHENLIEIRHEYVSVECELRDDSNAHIRSFKVANKMQGEGLGTEAMNRLLSTLRDIGIDRVTARIRLSERMDVHETEKEVLMEDRTVKLLDKTNFSRFRFEKGPAECNNGDSTNLVIADRIL